MNKIKKFMIFIPIPILIGCSGSSISIPDRSTGGTIEHGDPFPVISSETLGGMEITIPSDQDGKITLLIMGFSYKSRFQVEPWGKRFSKEYASLPGITFLEMPMMGSGLIELLKPFTDRGMRSGTPADVHNNVVCVYANHDALRERLGVVDLDAAHLFLLDGEGMLRWSFSGALTEEAYASLASAVTRLAGTNPSGISTVSR